MRLLTYLLLLTILASCQVNEFEPIEPETYPKDTLVVKVITDTSETIGKIAVGTKKRTPRSQRQADRIFARQSEEVLGEWLRTGIPKSLVYPDQFTASTEPATMGADDWYFNGWTIPDNHDRYYVDAWGWQFAYEKQQDPDWTGWEWHTVNVAPKDFPITQISYANSQGFTLPGLYLVKSQRYGWLFIKVQRYTAGKDPYLVWQANDYGGEDKVQSFDNMLWLTGHYDIFKLDE